MTAELAETRKDQILGQIPLGRYRRHRSEVAEVVTFLAGDGAATSPER